ncbi:hypothetical protein HPB47_006320, partial [Ixodes persulcatus]
MNRTRSGGEHALAGTAYIPLAQPVKTFPQLRFARSVLPMLRFLATSKFQPTYARRAFPCFDEPNFKSTFNVTLVHDRKHMALSNMPVLE